MAPFFFDSTFNLNFVLKFNENQMKKFGVFLLILTMALLLKSQHRLDSLTSQREIVYQKYRLHKDTVSVNTWLNIFKLNNYLGQLVVLDSLIISEIGISQSDESKRLDVAQSKLESLLSEKMDMSRRLSEAENSKHLMSKNLRLIIIAGGVSLLLFILFLVFFILTVNKLKKNNALVQEYHTNLYSAKSEIEQLVRDQENMAAAINMREKGFEEELKKFKDGLDQLSDEKTMLENQMIEVKKAYDREVERRLTAEERLNDIETSIGGNLNDSAVAENNVFYALQNEEINKLKIEIENERRIRLNIENELKKLLETLKEHYS